MTKKAREITISQAVALLKEANGYGNALLTQMEMIYDVMVGPKHCFWDLLKDSPDLQEELQSMMDRWRGITLNIYAGHQRHLDFIHGDDEVKDADHTIN
jgi:hypothetical protein